MANSRTFPTSRSGALYCASHPALALDTAAAVPLTRCLLALLLLLSVGNTAQAQNWATVRPSDTMYFRQTHPASELRLDSSRLRTVWVDSVSSFAGDSVFHFAAGLRLDRPANACVDTAWASVLGYLMIRGQDGSERYVNADGDTVLVRVNADAGTKWQMATDASRVVYEATVIAAGIRLVDGVADSVKTIEVRTFVNGIPVLHPQNGRRFEISKSQGWLSLPPLRYFPGLGGKEIRPVANEKDDTGTLFRLPSGFKSWRPGGIDLSWRYAVGNVELHLHAEGVPPAVPSLGADTMIRFDSVLQFVRLTQDKASVTFWSRSFVRKWAWRASAHTDTTYSYTEIRTDTIVSSSGTAVGSRPVHDPLTEPLPKGAAQFSADYHCGLMQDGRFSIDELQGTPVAQLVPAGGTCWALQGTSPDPEAHIRNYVQDFGVRMRFDYLANPAPRLWDYQEVIYAKLPGLEWGQRHVPAALSAGPALQQSGSWMVAPNPANSGIIISGSHNSAAFTAVLTNSCGAIVLQQSASGNRLDCNTANLPSGVYFLKLTTATDSWQTKLVIRH